MGAHEPISDYAGPPQWSHADYIASLLPERIPIHATPLTVEQTRMRIPRHRHRHTTADNPPTLAAALDFWALSTAAPNVAMQMAWPEIGRGVIESPVESGALTKHPWKRLRTTASYLAVAILGTEAEKREMREAVNAAHRQVRSQPGAKVKYNAFDRRAQLWVAACLYVGFEDAYQLLHGRMTAEQLESFYASGSTLGTTLQVPEDMWPTTRADFDDYWNAACARVALDDEVRAYVDDLLHLRMLRWYMRIPLSGLMQFLCAGYLAPHFREAMGIEWSTTDQRRFDNLFLFVGFVNRFMPHFSRDVGHKQMDYVRWRIRRKAPLV